MSIQRIAIGSLIPLLSACGSMTPSNNDTLTITSDPAGAQVYIMGDLAGTTPLEVPAKRVFPVTYPPEKTSLYGRITLKKEGCEDFQGPVSASAVAHGFKAKLTCQTAAGKEGAEAAKGDVRMRLEHLEALRRDHLITEEEYAAQRRRILNEL